MPGFDIFKESLQWCISGPAGMQIVALYPLAGLRNVSRCV